MTTAAQWFPAGYFQPGDYAVMRTSLGRKLVVIVQVSADGYRVRKWRAKSKCWTSIQAVTAREVFLADAAKDADLLRAADEVLP